MKYIYIFIIAFIIIITFYYLITNMNVTKRNNKFLFSECKRGTCYNDIYKCSSLKGYTYVDGSSDDKKIERKTFKCILNPEDKYNLLKLDSIFVPSMMDGTYCDIVYSTYYDYSDFTILKNRVYNLNLPLFKCIRIRKYHFNPNKYLEIKYSEGIKIRALIDDNYNILEKDKLDDETKELFDSILDKIKSNKINPIFNNVYKRLSFIYKHNPSMRITLDTNIEFFKNHIYKIMDKDILEIKIPNSVSIGEAEQYLKEINMLASTNLQFINFSKFEYYYYQVILKQ